MPHRVPLPFYLPQAQPPRGVGVQQGMSAHPAVSTETPPIFCEGNRPFWTIVRRLLIVMLKELDRAYGWQTFESDR